MRAVFLFLLGTAYAQDSGVNVQVTLERLQEKRWIALDPHLVLHGGDEVRFRFRSNRSGFLYVINHDGQGRNTWLFPTSDTGEQNAVQSDKDYIIPATSGVFQIAERPGYETTYWILSPKELRSRKEISREVTDPGPGTLIPRCGGGSGASSLTARDLCTDDTAGAHRAAATAIPKWFENIGPLRSRELTVRNGPEQSHINSAGAFDAPLVYEFRIAHQ